MHRPVVHRRIIDRRRLPAEHLRLLALQVVLLAACVSLGIVWAWQDWHLEQAQAVVSVKEAWLERNAPLFALGAALLLLAVNAGWQGAVTACRLERERRLALRDALTRLPNRRAFDRRLREIAVDPSQPASLLFVDLDGFKDLNDTFGHEAGDAALVGVAAALRSAVPAQEGLCCRWGGDEFAVLLPRTDRDHAEEVAARLEHALQRVVVARDGETVHHVRGSIGIATLRGGPGAGRTELLRTADAALADIKRARRTARRPVGRGMGAPEDAPA